MCMEIYLINIGFVFIVLKFSLDFFVFYWYVLDILGFIYNKFDLGENLFYIVIIVKIYI